MSSARMEEVILVDKNDVELGTMEKMEAHHQGALHRAISVFLFNDKQELLLQKRAEGKYHSANLWTNTCCSHPRPGETEKDAASRRLKEEMGIQTPLTWCLKFHYETKLERGLTENELDHVFIGHSTDLPQPDPDEVSDYKYISIEALKTDMASRPDTYTYWFKLILDKVLGHISRY